MRRLFALGACTAAGVLVLTACGGGASPDDTVVSSSQLLSKLEPLLSEGLECGQVENQEISATMSLYCLSTGTESFDSGTKFRVALKASRVETDAEFESLKSESLCSDENITDSDTSGRELYAADYVIRGTNWYGYPIRKLQDAERIADVTGGSVIPMSEVCKST